MTDAHGAKKRMLAAEDQLANTLRKNREETPWKCKHLLKARGKRKFSGYCNAPSICPDASPYWTLCRKHLRQKRDKLQRNLDRANRVLEL